MDEELMGTIKLFAGNFAPVGYMLCQGQQLPISQYSALYAILGTTYGGDGRTTFGLPNLQASVPVGTDTAGKYPLGLKAGTETVTLTVSNLPAHNHPGQIAVSTSNSTIATPTAGSVLSVPGSGTGRNFVSTLGYIEATPNLNLTNGVTVGNTGGNTPVSNMQPFVTFNYIICVQGIFPSRQ